MSPVRTLFIAQLYLAVGVKECVHYSIIRFCVNRLGENPQIAVRIFGLRDESRFAMNVAAGQDAAKGVQVLLPRKRSVNQRLTKVLHLR